MSYILNRYKIAFLLSFTVGIAVLALRLERDILDIFGIFLGAFVGTFFMDLEYFVRAYWDEPNEEFSVALKQHINQRNYLAALNFIDKNRYSVQKKLMHSVLFQVILIVLAFFVVTSYGNGFALGLALSIVAQSFYKMFEEYESRGNIASWFWVLKEQPNKQSQTIYVILALVSFVYILYLL